MVLANRLDAGSSVIKGAGAAGVTDGVDLFEILEDMVAGSFEVGSADDPFSIALMHVEDMVHSNKVHAMVRVVDGVAYYLAIPSHKLSSQPEFMCPFTAAVPGARDHRGDGVYLLNVGPNAAAVIKQGSRLRYFVASGDEMRDLLRSDDFADLETFDLAGQIGEPLRTEQWAYRALVVKASGWVIKGCLGVFMVACSVFLICQITLGALKGLEPTKLEAITREVAKLVNSIPLDQPIGKQMESISDLSAAVVANNGGIDGYVYDEAGGERFTLSMPAWIGKDVYEKFGSDVKVVPQPDTGDVWVIKAGAGGMTIKDVGPQEVVAQPVR